MKRYCAIYVPVDKVEAAARRRGMKDGDGSSFWDWVEPEFFDEAKDFNKFGAAVHQAKKWLDDDAFGEVRVVEQVTTDDQEVPLWDDARVWHIREKTDQPSIKHPDHIYGIGE